MDIEIQTYWNVETLAMVFNAIAAVMNAQSFDGLLRFAFVFGLALAIFGYIGRQLEMFKWFIHAFIFVMVLNLPIANVILTDKSGLEPPREVDNVPFALAAVAQATNLVFGSMTSAYETAFGVPDALGLRQGDVGFGHRILRQVNKATIRDPELRADLMQFIKECTLYDVRDGEISHRDIVSGVDTWNTIFTNTSPARFVTYDSLSAPKTQPCTEVALVLSQRVGTAATADQASAGRMVFTRAENDQVASALFVNAVGSSYDWILKNSANASDAMRQAMFNNLWRDAGSELPALLNDPARVSEVSALMGSAQAARQAAGSQSTLSLLAQETLPHVRNWIEAIIYALFPVVVVLMVVSSTEGAKKIFVGYLMSLAWIGLWPLLFAVINHLSMIHLSRKLAAFNLADKGVPFQYSDAFDATIVDEQAAIGYMVILVPFIASLIIRMGQGGFTAIADRVMTSFSSAGAAAGASMALGNAHMGQVGMDTASLNMTSMHRHDATVGLRGGVSSVETPDGAQMIRTANGTVGTQELRAHVAGVSLSPSQSEQANVSHGGHLQRESAASQAVSYRNGEQVSGQQQLDRMGAQTDGQGRNLAAVMANDMTDGMRRQDGSGTSLTNQSMFQTEYGGKAGLNVSLGGGSGGGGSGGRSGLGFSGGLSGGLHAGFNQVDSESRTDTSHSDLSREQAHASRASVTASQDQRQQDDQTLRQSRNVTYNNMQGRDSSIESSIRSGHGIDDRASLSRSYGFESRRDLAQEPAFITQAIKSAGLRGIGAFNRLSVDEKREVLLNEAIRQGLVAPARTMPSHSFDGQRIPSDYQDLKDQTAKVRNIDGLRNSDKVKQHYIEEAGKTMKHRFNPSRISNDAEISQAADRVRQRRDELGDALDRGGPQESPSGKSGASGKW